jgi:hypothetical protein
LGKMFANFVPQFDPQQLEKLVLTFTVAQSM